MNQSSFKLIYLSISSETSFIVLNRVTEHLPDSQSHGSYPVFDPANHRTDLPASLLFLSYFLYGNPRLLFLFCSLPNEPEQIPALPTPVEHYRTPRSFDRFGFVCNLY